MVVSLIKRLREPELWWVQRTPRGRVGSLWRQKLGVN